MRKIILLSIGLSAILSADPRYAMSMGAGYVGSMIENNNGIPSSLNTNGQYGDQNGFNIRTSFIVNDGLLYGNGGYLKIQYDRVDGVSNGESRNNFIQKKMEAYNVELTEEYWTRKYHVYSGIVAENNNIDMTSTLGDTSSYKYTGLGLEFGGEYNFNHWLSIGGLIGATYLFNGSITINGYKEKINTGTNYFASLPIRFKINQNFNILWETKVKHVSIGGTNISYNSNTRAGFDIHTSTVSFNMVF